jgi:hypothetical protein
MSLTWWDEPTVEALRAALRRVAHGDLHGDGVGDAWWRAEAGVALPDHRTPARWVDDLDARFAALGPFG